MAENEHQATWQAARPVPCPGRGAQECLLRAGGLRGGGPPTGRTHPMFHCFGCMCGFLLSVIWCEDINDGHEVDLLLGGTWRGNKEEEVASS